MKIAFVLPTLRTVPSGGFRVHYEYANRLAARGHRVTVVHWEPSRRRRFGIRRRGVRSFVPWFRFDPTVKLRVVPEHRIPRSEVGVLTGWRTAAALPTQHGRVRRSVQIVYDYEFWALADATTRARMAASFLAPDISVATSGAVTAMLAEVGRTPDALVACAIDHEVYGIDVEPVTRAPAVGLVLWSEVAKRCEDAIRALEILRRTQPVRVVAVGADRMTPGMVPDWIERFDAPDDAAMRAFYNRVSVFVLSSEYEGWGLPAAEAMACGAALVATRCGGVEDFAVHGTNALLVPSREPEAIAAAVARMLDDDELRRRLVVAAQATVAEMRWDGSVDALEQVMRDPSG